MNDAVKSRYGPRKLGQKAFEEQQSKQKMTSRDGTTVFGKRKAGSARPEFHERKAAAEVEKKGEATEWGKLSIKDLDARLTAEPGLLDIASVAELERAEPRKGAAEILLRFEKERPGGAREQMVKLLGQVGQ